MPPPQLLLPLCGALVFGVAVGWAGSGLITPRQRSPETGAEKSLTEPHTSRNTPASSTSRNSPAAGASSLSTSALSAKSPEFLHELRAALSLDDRDEVRIRVEELISLLAPEDFPVAYLAAKNLDDSQPFLLDLATHWARLDPRGAAVFAATHSASDNYLATVGAEWAAQDLKGSIAWLESTLPQPGHGDLTFLILNVVLALSKDDPRAALDLWSRQKRSIADWVKREGPNDLYVRWANSDPNAAATAAWEVRGTEPSALTDVVKTWAAKDGAAAEAWVGQLPSGAMRKVLERGVGQALADSDPAAAMAWAAKCQDPYISQFIFKAALPKYAASDLSGALQAIDGMPAGKMRDSAISAATWALSANGDSKGALQLFARLPAGPERNDAASAISYHMGTSDPRAALDWLVANGTLAGNVRNSTIQAWLAQSPDEALSWAKALPSGENRDAALSSIAQIYIPKDTAQAEALFTQLTPDGQERFARPMIRQLAARDLDQARQWAETVHPGEAQAIAFGYVADGWYKQDPAAAAQWLKTLPNGQGRDSAIALIVTPSSQKIPPAPWPMRFPSPMN